MRDIILLLATILRNQNTLASMIRALGTSADPRIYEMLTRRSDELYSASLEALNRGRNNEDELTLRATRD